MSIATQPEPVRDPFAKSKDRFDQLAAWAGGPAAEALDHDRLEEQSVAHLMELGRQVLQDHYDLRLERERLAPPPEQGKRRVRARDLETIYGTVQVSRMAVVAALVEPPVDACPAAAVASASSTPSASPEVQHKRPPQVATMPMDRALSLPAQRYSLPVQWRVVQFALDTSYDRAGHTLATATAAHVPKRQRIEVIERVAQDYEAFYETFERPANDTMGPKTLLVSTTDGKGMRMRPEGLRDDTRKLAEAEHQEAVKGDPLAPRKARTHDRRMAQLGAVYEQEPLRRRPKDILRELMAPARRGKPNAKRAKSTRKGPKRSRRRELPRPQNRRFLGSLKDDTATVILKVFAEAQARDPEHRQPWVMLVDGQEHAMAVIHAEAERLHVALTIVVDLLHVQHYLWIAAKALFPQRAREAREWVGARLMGLLTSAPMEVIAGIRRSATLRGAEGETRKAVDLCANYLEKNVVGIAYAEFLKRGLPIATGVIEGACRHLVQDRMNLSGARWGLDGGEAMLKLRLLDASGHLDLYRFFHARREHQRNYPKDEAG